MEPFSAYLDTAYDPLMAGSIDGTDTEPHDRAISRAMAARYAPNAKVKGDADLTLFVARLSPRTDEDTLYSAFRRFGPIRRHRLVRDLVTGFSKCYGFVEFDSERALRDAYRDGRGLVVDDKEVLVDYERERRLSGWVPRRLGGGFGGKKESGQLRFGGRDRPFRKPFIAPAQLTAQDSGHRPRYGGDRNWKDTRGRERSESDSGSRYDRRQRRSRSPVRDRYRTEQSYSRR